MLLKCNVGEDFWVSWTAGRSTLSTVKEINPEYSLEGLMLKLQYFDHLMWNWFIRKVNDTEKDWRQEEKGTTEDETVRWHHWLNGHEFEWAPRVGDGQGSPVCCSPWDHKESDMTEWLNWTNNRNHWLHLLWPKMEKLYIVSKNKTWSWLWLRLLASVNKIHT